MADQNESGAGQPADEQIRADVQQRLAADTDLSTSNIDVQARDGQVILSGVVDSADARLLAEDVARSAPGVKNVVNKLKASSLEKELRR